MFTTYDAVNCFVTEEILDGTKVLQVIKDPKVIAFDEPTFARLHINEFQDGVIEVQVLSRLLDDAPDFARGFIGVAFRINEDNTQYESIYIRPTNGRSDNQFRRNHSTQYYAYPDYKFERLREEEPGMYESYVDIGLDEWITLKIEVNNNTAMLYVNNALQPALIVNDLKLGTTSGAIGLWTDIGTLGYFKDLKITYK